MNLNANRSRPSLAWVAAGTLVIAAICAMLWSASRSTGGEQSADNSAAPQHTVGALLAANSTDAKPGRRSGPQPAAEFHDRLERARKLVDTTLGTSCVVMVDETGSVGLSERGGIVKVDLSTAVDLGEEALTALLAHEFAHHHLGHVERRATPTDGRDKATEQAKWRSEEMDADYHAGFVLGAHNLPAVAFEELLGATLQKPWPRGPDRAYYTRAQRMAAFERGYAQGHRSRGTRHTRE
jgi:hypothetical protein